MLINRLSYRSCSLCISSNLTEITEKRISLFASPSRLFWIFRFYLFFGWNAVKSFVNRRKGLNLRQVVVYNRDYWKECNGCLSQMTSLCTSLIGLDLVTMHVCTWLCIRVLTRSLCTCLNYVTAYTCFNYVAVYTCLRARSFGTIPSILIPV